MNKKIQFAKIYDKFVDQIFRFIFIKVNSKEIAEDLTSETFLKTWTAFSNGKISNPKAFLYKTARNLIIDYYRDKSKNNFLSLEEIPEAKDSNPSFFDQILKDEKIALIKSALQELKEEYQEVITLRYLNGLSIKEISQILEKSPEAIRTSLSRAIQALKEICNKKQKISSS